MEMKFTGTITLVAVGRENLKTLKQLLSEEIPESVRGIAVGSGHGAMESTFPPNLVCDEFSVNSEASESVKEIISRSALAFVLVSLGEFSAHEVLFRFLELLRESGVHVLVVGRIPFHYEDDERKVLATACMQRLRDKTFPVLPIAQAELLAMARPDSMTKDLNGHVYSTIKGSIQSVIDAWTSDNLVGISRIQLLETLTRDRYCFIHRASGNQDTGGRDIADTVLHASGNSLLPTSPRNFRAYPTICILRTSTTFPFITIGDARVFIKRWNGLRIEPLIGYELVDNLKPGSFEVIVIASGGNIDGKRENPKIFLDIDRRIEEIKTKRGEHANLSIIDGAKTPADKPQVGIWWVFQGRVIQHSIDAATCPDPSDTQSAEVEHLYAWPLAQQRFASEIPEILELKYDNVARGRVCYHRDLKQFSLACDDHVANNPAILKLIAQAFGIGNRGYVLVTHTQYINFESPDVPRIE